MLAMPKADHAHLLLYFVAETMRKSLRRASAASGPKSSFCSSLQTREQNFLSSSSWIALNKEDVLNDLPSGDLPSGDPEVLAEAVTEWLLDAGTSLPRRVPQVSREEGGHTTNSASCDKLADWFPHLTPPWDSAIHGPLLSPAGQGCWGDHHLSGLKRQQPLLLETPHI